MAQDLEKHIFPDGRVAHTMTHALEPGGKQRGIVRWEDMAGNITGWGKVEAIKYASTLGEQYLNSREVIAQ